MPKSRFFDFKSTFYAKCRPRSRILRSGFANLGSNMPTFTVADKSLHGFAPGVPQVFVGFLCFQWFSEGFCWKTYRNLTTTDEIHATTYKTWGKPSANPCNDQGRDGAHNFQAYNFL